MLCGENCSVSITFVQMILICYVVVQYDFPKQDAVIQFVIDAIQAEAFNTKTLFLIGTYTIGKFLSCRTIVLSLVYGYYRVVFVKMGPQFIML